MSQPRVSVVLPVFNGAATVARAIADVRAQTLPEWELIAVDDGSTDGTRDVLGDLARAEPRLHVLSGPHAGIVAALNVGIAAARTPLIARLDADDEMHPERLAAQVAFLDAHPAVGLVSCLVDYGGDAVASHGYALHVAWLNSLGTPEAIILNRFVESPFAHPSVVFRRELVARFGGYRDGDFPEDYELWLRWLDAGVRMAKVPQQLITWHDPPTRLSRAEARYAPAAFFRVKAEYVARELHRRGVGPVWIWGAGRLTRRRAEPLLGHGVRFAGYIDIDPKKIGRPAADGLPVIAPAQLPPPAASADTVCHAHHALGQTRAQEPASAASVDAPGESRDAPAAAGAHLSPPDPTRLRLPSPTWLAGAHRPFVLGYVTSRGARDLIRAELTAHGYLEGRDFLMCA